MLKVMMTIIDYLGDHWVVQLLTFIDHWVVQLQHSRILAMSHKKRDFVN